MEKQIINPLDKNEFTDCLSCKSNLRGMRVKKSDEEFFGEFTHYSQLIPMRDEEGLLEEGIIIRWRCPYCNFNFPRFE